MDHPLLKQLLTVRESRLHELVNLNLQAIEQVLMCEPTQTIIVIDNKGERKCNTVVWSMVANALTDGGLKATLQVGYLSTILEVKIPDFDLPRSSDELPLLKRILTFRETRFNELTQQIMNAIASEVRYDLSQETIVIDVCATTQVTDPQTWIRVCQHLNNGGLQTTFHKGRYSTITVVLPPFDGKTTVPENSSSEKTQ